MKKLYGEVYGLEFVKKTMDSGVLKIPDWVEDFLNAEAVDR